MKTNTTYNKETARQMKENYLAKQREVDRERYAYQQAVLDIHSGENEVVKEMVDALRRLYKKYNRPITAFEVYNEVSDKMTYQEVVAILTVAANEHWNGSGRTQRTRFDCLKGIKLSKDCKQHFKAVTRRFAEIDADGNMIPDGKTLELERIVCAYTIAD